jgi:tetratricopeptide (TPR) repeat protein
MMASVDPYSPCPCGSGQKFKWCCQKVESYAERAQRMVDNGQYESAIKPLDEGLNKVPDNPWLLARKALIQIHLKQVEPAKQTLRSLIQKNPGHLGGTILITRLALETEGARAGISHFQQGLSAIPPERRRLLAPLAHFLGVSLKRMGFPIAAIKHAELAQQWSGGKDESIASSLGSLLRSPELSIWEKNPYFLWPPAQGVAEQFRESFERALGWAREGLWSSAASAFELLAAGSSAGAIADRNRGLCCLWIADHDGAVAALRRYITRTGPTIDAVDLEALCQRIGADAVDDAVEFVHLSWPVRNRDGLLAALRAEPTFEPGPARPVDPDQTDSPQAERFFLLDRATIAAKAGLARGEIPMVEGEVLVGADIVVLETYDDGRLDRLVDRFTGVARSNIPPAHPRTKVIGREPRAQSVLNFRWRIPDGVPEPDVERLEREQFAYLVRSVWPATPQTSLRGRTPLQAAGAGDSETALRAALCLLESASEEVASLVDWDELRSQLRLKPEPPVDPDQVDLGRLHMSRWSSIPVADLDDDRLIHLYHQARQFGMTEVMNRAARVIARRPTLLVKGRIEAVVLYGELALDSARHGDRAGAAEWMERGRQFEPPLKQTANALQWEMLDLQTKMILDEPEVWVPVLAVILQRYRGNQEALSAVLMRLVELGLVHAAVDPKRPGQILLDTQLLDQYLSQYGPRVTTAAGDLGVSASQGELWTPESTRGGAGSPIWTPGSDTGLGSRKEPSKIILPGQ